MERTLIQQQYNMPEKRNIPFRIKGIETVQFALIEDAYKEDCNINLLVSVPISASDEGHSIEVTLNTQFKCEQTPFIVLEIRIQFDIEDEAFQSLYVTKKKKTSLVIPVGLSRHLATIAVGTARGILHEKLSKTKLNDLVFPTVDLTTILEKDVVLEKKG